MRQSIKQSWSTDEIIRTRLDIRDEGEETIEIFVPLEIKKRGGTAMVIMPRKSQRGAKLSDENELNTSSAESKYFDERIIKTLAKAYKWKVMLEEEQVSSLAEIAEKEAVNTSYVSKIFDLNFLSPKIIDHLLNGIQPRTLRLKDIVGQEIPYSWGEQEERWGFRPCYL